jgi:hypothetical protein
MRKTLRFERGFYFHFQVENYEEILRVYGLTVLIIQYFKYLLSTAVVMFLQNKDSLLSKRLSLNMAKDSRSVQEIELCDDINV